MSVRPNPPARRPEAKRRPVDNLIFHPTSS